MSSSQSSVGEARSDPIKQFIEEQHFHGRSERTLRAYRRVLRHFESHVFGDGDVGDLQGIDRRACMEWVHTLREDLKPSTIATYATYVNRFYGYMADIGEFDQNPMRIVIEQMPESIESNPHRRDLSLSRMREFVGTIQHPLDRAVVMTFLKTGMRVGELCNLDLQDVSLNNLPLDIDLPSPRGGLDARQDAFFIDNTPTRGDIINGERRTASNKRQRTTIVPIDDELRSVLIAWLAIRPDSPSPAEPLFVDTRTSWGDRLTTEDVRYRVRKYAQAFGWYEVGGNAEHNVTPHYFRHFFTTYLRDRTGDRGIVKYLRGDVADDVIDTYTHNWGDRVRQRYEQHIYSLL